MKTTNDHGYDRLLKISAAKKAMRIFESFDHKQEMKKMKMTTDDEGKTPTNKVVYPKNV